MALPKIPLYVRGSLAMSCVAMLFGLDIGMIGPVTSMHSFRDAFGHFSPLIHGAIISSILLTGALTALIAGALAHQFGHVRLVALGSLCYAVGAAIECGAPSGILGVFIFGRLVKGVGKGLFLSNVYVQVAEMSPARRRGIITALPQALITFGIVFGYFICYGTAHLGGEASWRVPLGLASGLGLALASCAWVTPPSPRWLISRGRLEEARAVAESLGLDDKERDELLAQPECAAATPPGVAEATRRGSTPPAMSNTSLADTLRQTGREFCLALSGPYLGRTAFACFLMCAQQWAGIDGVLYYAPMLFERAGLDGYQASLIASGITGVVIFAVTIPATFLADAWSRRTASIVGGVGMAFSMLLIGSLYAADIVRPRNAASWIIIVFIYIYTIFFNITWPLCFRTYICESLPKRTRSSASSLAQSSNWLANFSVALTTPVLLAASSFAVYFVWSACILVTTVIIVYKMSETRGISLETIEENYERKKSLQSTPAATPDSTASASNFWKEVSSQHSTESADKV